MLQGTVWPVQETLHEILRQKKRYFKRNTLLKAMGFLPTGCGSCCEQERSPVSTSLEATQETLVVLKLKHV